jgi:hypothetical protein
MFRPFTGSLSGLYNKLESVLLFFLDLRAKRDPVWFTVLYTVCKGSDEKMED